MWGISGGPLFIKTCQNTRKQLYRFKHMQHSELVSVTVIDRPTTVTETLHKSFSFHPQPNVLGISRVGKKHKKGQYLYLYLYLYICVCIYTYMYLHPYLWDKAGFGKTKKAILELNANHTNWSWQFYILSNEAVEGWGRSALTFKTGQLLSRSGSFRPKINLIMSLFASELKWTPSLAQIEMKWSKGWGKLKHSIDTGLTFL